MYTVERKSQHDGIQKFADHWMKRRERAGKVAKIWRGRKQMGKARKNKETAELDLIVEEVTTDAYGDDECYVAFQTVLEDETGVPCAGSVLGEDVTIEGWEYDGNERRGVTVKCRKPDGGKYEVAAWDVELPKEAAGTVYLVAYRHWLGMKAVQQSGKTEKKSTARAKKGVEKLGSTIELTVLAEREKAFDCGVLGDKDGREVVFRAAVKGIVPGELVQVAAKRRWVYAGQESIEGEITATRIDVKLLGLEPLKLKREGTWNPRDMDWGEEGPSVEEWTRMLPVNTRGKRPQFEMEQVVPGTNFEEEIDPIIEANELKERGDAKGARRILMELCRQDLRCIDAHVHLGNLAFDRKPEIAIKHYEVGVRIGELSLGDGFDGVLPWGLIDNRPFLRCVQGYGLGLWRMERFKEAEGVFRRMLMLNPMDNQGVRFLIDSVVKKEAWREDME